MAKQKATAIVTSERLRSIRNVDIFTTELTQASDAAIGVFAIRTREFYRCIDTLRDWSIEQEMDFKVWSVLKGWQSYLHADKSMLRDSGDSSAQDMYKPVNHDKKIALMDAFAALEEGTEFRSRGCYVLFCPQFSLAQPGIQQHIRDHVQRAMSNSQRLVLLMPDTTDIPQELSDDLYLLDFKTPSHNELKNLWTSLLENIEPTCRPEFTDADVDLIVQNSIGMTQQEFDNAVALAFVKNMASLSSDSTLITAQHFIDVIMETKVSVIKKTDILELLPRASMEEIGGMDKLKRWFEIRKIAFSDEAKKFGVDTPKGVLLVGPPGSGKSIVAKAIASVLGIPCVRLDVGRVFGQFVGQSESRMRRALQLIESMAPLTLLIDEVDKGFGGIGGANDSGTSSRVFGTFLTWMQERDNSAAPVMVAMTANNVTGIPAELLRKGRMDEIFAVSFPTIKERIQILKIHLSKRGHSLSEEDLQTLANKTETFVGAELEAVVKDAITEAFADNKKQVELAYLIKQVEETVPLSKSFKKQVDAMHEWAAQNARSASSDVDFAAVKGAQSTISAARAQVKLRSRMKQPGKSLDN